MQFIQYLRREAGSHTVGFALVAPLLVGAFLAVSQIANVVNVQTVMHAAAISGAREAGRYDASIVDGATKAKSILANHGITEFDQLTVINKKLSGQEIIEISITKNYRIPWLDFSIKLTAVGQSLNEKYL